MRACRLCLYLCFLSVVILAFSSSARAQDPPIGPVFDPAVLGESNLYTLDEICRIIKSRPPDIPFAEFPPTANLGITSSAIAEKIVRIQVVSTQWFDGRIYINAPATGSLIQTSPILGPLSNAFESVTPGGVYVARPPMTPGMAQAIVESGMSPNCAETWMTIDQCRRGATFPTIGTSGQIPLPATAAATSTIGRSGGETLPSGRTGSFGTRAPCSNTLANGSVVGCQPRTLTVQGVVDLNAICQGSAKIQVVGDMAEAMALYGQPAELNTQGFRPSGQAGSVSVGLLAMPVIAGATFYPTYVAGCYARDGLEAMGAAPDQARLGGDLAAYGVGAALTPVAVGGLNLFGAGLTVPSVTGCLVGGGIPFMCGESSFFMMEAMKSSFMSSGMSEHDALWLSGGLGVGFGALPVGLMFALGAISGPLALGAVAVIGIVAVVRKCF